MMTGVYFCGTSACALNVYLLSIPVAVNFKIIAEKCRECGLW